MRRCNFNSAKDESMLKKENLALPMWEVQCFYLTVDFGKCGKEEVALLKH
jgi:hypothetical protein